MFTRKIGGLACLTWLALSFSVSAGAPSAARKSDKPLQGRRPLDRLVTIRATRKPADQIAQDLYRKTGVPILVVPEAAKTPVSLDLSMTPLLVVLASVARQTATSITSQYASDAIDPRPIVILTRPWFISGVMCGNRCNGFYERSGREIPTLVSPEVLAQAEATAGPIAASSPDPRYLETFISQAPRAFELDGIIRGRAPRNWRGSLLDVVPWRFETDDTFDSIQLEPPQEPDEASIPTSFAVALVVNGPVIRAMVTCSLVNGVGSVSTHLVEAQPHQGSAARTWHGETEFDPSRLRKLVGLVEWSDRNPLPLESTESTLRRSRRLSVSSIEQKYPLIPMLVLTDFGGAAVGTSTLRDDPRDGHIRNAFWSLADHGLVAAAERDLLTERATGSADSGGGR